MAFTVVPGTDLDGDSGVKTGVVAKLVGNIEALSADTHEGVVKPSDEVETGIVYQDDDDIVFAVGTNEVWMFRCVLIVTTAAANDIRVRFTVPAGTTGDVSYVAHDGTSVEEAGSFAIATGTIINYLAPAAEHPLILDGFVVTAGTAGNVQLQWARGAGGVADVTLHTGSYIETQRMDTVGASTYSDIADTEVDSRSEIIAALMSKFYDNPIALYDNTRKYVIKSADQDNATTTYANDDELLFAMGTNETWWFRFILFVTLSIARDIKIQFTGPAGTTGFASYVTHDGSTVEAGSFAITTGEALIDYANAPAAKPMIIEGWAKTAGTAGNLTLQWAQRIGNAAPATTIHGTAAGPSSFLRAQRMDTP